MENPVGSKLAPPSCCQDLRCVRGWNLDSIVVALHYFWLAGDLPMRIIAFIERLGRSMLRSEVKTLGIRIPRNHKSLHDSAWSASAVTLPEMSIPYYSIFKSHSSVALMRRIVTDKDTFLYSLGNRWGHIWTSAWITTSLILSTPSNRPVRVTKSRGRNATLWNLPS